MYWPIGTPRIYASSDQHVATPTVDSGEVESAETIEIQVSKSTAPTHGVDGGQVPFPNSDDVQSTTTNGKTKKSKPRGTNKPGRVAHIGGEILGARLSRSGHIFVTITFATLTVWQTKVITS
jgi:hypothetical protein